MGRNEDRLHRAAGPAGVPARPGDRHRSPFLQGSAGCVDGDGIVLTCEEPCFQSAMGAAVVPGTPYLCAVNREVLVFSGCNSHPATGSLQPVAIGAAVEVTKPSEPSRQTGRFGDSASRQAVIASER